METAGIATFETITINDDETVLDAITLMAENGIRRLPVLNPQGLVSGIVTAKDILKVLGYNPLKKALSMPVSKIMTPDPLVIDARASVQEAVDKMARYNVGSLLVVIDEQGTFGGIVTERDIVRHFAEALADADLAEFITRNVITVTADENVHESIKIMTENSIRRLIISPDKKKIEAIVTATDIIRYIYNNSETLLKGETSLYKIPIIELATKDVITADINSSVKEVVKIMIEKNIGALPITENNELAGIFTERDLVRMISIYNLLPD